jgi:hypothetical protein
MNPLELQLPDGRPAGVFICEKCRRLGATRLQVEKCCQPHACPRCGLALKTGCSAFCDQCYRAKKAENERERFALAEKLTDWDGPVYLDDTGRNGFSDTLKSFLEGLPAGEPRPEYVWACNTIEFVRVSADDILENIGDDAYEDWDGEMNGVPEFQAACEAFNLANRKIVSWEPDYTKAVLLDKDKLLKPGPDKDRDGEQSPETPEATAA